MCHLENASILARASQGPLLCLLGTMPKRALQGFASGRVGGSRQRVAVAQAQAQADAPPQLHSALVAYLLEQWSWGLLTTPKVQIILEKAHEDLISHAAGRLRISEVSSLAGIGAGGSQSKNSLRDFGEQAC